jgi:Protein of unknown function (DUF3429)
MGPADLDAQTVEHRVTESRRVPALSLVLGYGATVPFVAGAAAAWLLGRGGLAALAADLTVLWGGAILVFLAGVRRGLSFRTEGGPTPAQLAASLGLFALGLAALAAPRTGAALALLLVGYAALAVLDPWAARRGEAPLFFARLRPLQMLVPVAGLAALLAHLAARP